LRGKRDAFFEKDGRFFLPELHLEASYGLQPTDIIALLTGQQ
jgi:hypothetical protein